MGNAASVLSDETRMAQSKEIEVIDLTGDDSPILQRAALPIPRPRPSMLSLDRLMEVEGDGDDYIPPLPRLDNGTASAPILIHSPDDIVIFSKPEKVPRADANGVLTIFCDGSFLANVWGGAGVAYCVQGQWGGRSLALGHIRDTFQAEATAMFEALKAAGELQHSLNHQYIKIYTDSRDVLNALRFAKDDMDRVQEARRQLVHSILYQKQKLLDDGYEVALCWVKGHFLSEGNELADKLASKGSRASGNRKQIVAGRPYTGPVVVSEAEWKAMVKGSRENVASRKPVEDRHARKLETRRLAAGGRPNMSARFAEIAEEARQQIIGWTR